MRAKHFTTETTAAHEGLRELVPVEIRQTSSTLRFIADLPGVRWEDLQIAVDASHLVLSGRRRSRAIHDGESVAIGELLYGSFARTFDLPAHVDVEHVTSDFEDGVLTVTLPVT